MSVKSAELALTITNAGKGYARRLGLARTARDQATNAGSQRMTAEAWTRVASDGARAWERQFGCYAASYFTALDILQAAAELAEYYAGHLAEIDALAAAEAV